MVKKCWGVWCKLNQQKDFNRIIFKVDLKYPDKLHVLHNDYPLGPEKLAVSYNMLSDNCKKTADEYEIKFGDENVRLVNNKKDFLKFTSRPTHSTHKIFAKNYVAIHKIKPALTLNKPIYAGFTVLESSKWLMYNFHYNFIKKNFDADLLLLTQTVLRMK